MDELPFLVTRQEDRLDLLRVTFAPFPEAVLELLIDYCMFRGRLVAAFESASPVVSLFWAPSTNTIPWNRLVAYDGFMRQTWSEYNLDDLMKRPIRTKKIQRVPVAQQKKLFGGQACDNVSVVPGSNGAIVGCNGSGVGTAVVVGGDPDVMHLPYRSGEWTSCAALTPRTAVLSSDDSRPGTTVVDLMTRFHRPVPGLHGDVCAYGSPSVDKHSGCWNSRFAVYRAPLLQVVSLRDVSAPTSKAGCDVPYDADDAYNDLEFEMLVAPSETSHVAAVEGKIVQHTISWHPSLLSDSKLGAKIMQETKQEQDPVQEQRALEQEAWKSNAVFDSVTMLDSSSLLLISRDGMCHWDTEEHAVTARWPLPSWPADVFDESNARPLCFPGTSVMCWRGMIFDTAMPNVPVVAITSPSWVMAAIAPLPDGRFAIAWRETTDQRWIITIWE